MSDLLGMKLQSVVALDFETIMDTSFTGILFL